MIDKQKHAARVREELVFAGLTNRSLGKSECKHLPDLIHEKEHVHAAVMGRTNLTTNALLVATDRKILFIDSSPMFVNTDEVTYEVVSGVSFGKQGLANEVTLHTKIKDFTLILVNAVSAKKFVKYIEQRRLEGDGDLSEFTAKESSQKQQPKYSLTKKERTFLQAHKLSTLATLGTDGRVTAATVYYGMDADDNLLVMTKEGTDKARNILQNPDVAVVITDESSMATMQIQARAYVETDNKKRQAAFDAIIGSGNNRKPKPIQTINAGAFVPFRLEIFQAQYSEFKSSEK